MSADITYILSTLLDKYESSSLFRSGSSQRRVMIRCADDKVIKNSFDRPHDTEVFNNSIRKLKAENLIDYDFERGQSYEIVEHIYLETGNIRKAYEYIDRTPLEVLLEEFVELVTSHSYDDDGIRSYLDDVLYIVKTRRHFSAPFTNDLKHDSDIILALSALCKGNEETLERVFSQKLYGYSKHFEKEVRDNVLSVLQHVEPEVPQEALLGRYGVTRYPEIIEFAGPLTTPQIDYSSLSDGAYINSTTIWKLDDAYTSAASLLTIENKANYIDYLQRRSNDELVIYTGGFPSPALCHLLSMLLKDRSDLRCTHWGDIDLGGFRIFVSLRKIVPLITPWLMDRKTLETFRDKAMPIESEAYLEKLEKLMNDDEFSIFYPVIDLMLKEKLKLEQEALLS